MPNQHIPWHRPELQQLVLVILESLPLNVHEDGPFVHGLILMRSLEVDWSAIRRRRLVHGDPEPDPLVPRDGTVLIVLMPFETFVGIDHEEIGRHADLVRATALSEDVSHGGMVVEVGEGLVGLPYVALDIVVELGGSAREGPKVRVFHLVSGGRSEVFDPVVVEDILDVDDTVSFEGLDLGLGDLELFGSRDAGFYSVGEAKLWILQAEVVFP